MNEQVLLFGQEESLVGIITDPPNMKRKDKLPLVIILNSGMIHRVGPNRLSVRIARSLSNMGFVTFRFDLSGIGDSSASSDGASFIGERWLSETQEAMSTLSRVRGVEQFILIGNCSGGALSLITAFRDQRVVGLVPINPQAERKVIRYFVRLALFNPKSWLRLIGGKMKFQEIKKVFKRRNSINNSTQNEFLQPLEITREIKKLLDRETKILFIYCEWDPNLDYFRAFINKKIDVTDSNVRVEIIKDTDHDFHLVWGQEKLIQLVHNWGLQFVQHDC